MSIPEYSSHSTITSSSKKSFTLFSTNINTANKNKTNNRFDSDSSIKNPIPNNMWQIKTSKINNTQYYTLNDTTDSDSITSKSISTKNSNNSDTSYQPSTNDNITSQSLNKINADSKSLKTSNEFIQQNLITSTNNNNTSSTNNSPKFQNNKLRQKKNTI